jgi:hypothetical protein
MESIIYQPKEATLTLVELIIEIVKNVVIEKHSITFWIAAHSGSRR